jgi:hypothetical protein
MIKRNIPFTEQRIRALKAGDMVLISGIMFGGSDAVACPPGPNGMSD